MLQEIFYWILNMSIAASITGMLVMGIRLWKRLPRRMMVFLWIIPFLRMIVPIGVISEYSILSLLSESMMKSIVVYRPAEEIALSASNMIMAAESYFPIVYKSYLLEVIFRIASIVWIVGASILVCMLAILYVTTLCEIRDAKHVKEKIYLSDKIISPAVYGIVRPKIVLPASYEQNNLEFILLHEEMHIRRGDNLWRMAAFLIVAVHWFNPLAWLFLKLYLTDLELSCDECVLVKLDAGYTKEYAKSLLENSQHTSVFSSGFGGAKLKNRIENILSFRRITTLSFVAFCLFMFAVFYVSLTNAS